MHRLPRLLEDSFSDDPALDTAVSRALMFRVAAGELPETLRIARPGTTVAFAKRDAVTDGYEEAVRAAREHGFEATLRLAGGRAAVFHDGTMEIGHAIPDEEPRAGIHDRFRHTADRLARALASLGVDARVGEVAGEYCPGRYSVNARGAAKLAGHRPAHRRRRIAHRHRSWWSRARTASTRCSSRSTRRWVSTGRRRRAAQSAPRPRAPAGTRSATRSSPNTHGSTTWSRSSIDAETLELAQSLAGEHRVG